MSSPKKPPKQLLHLVFGGELTSLDSVEFRDLNQVVKLTIFLTDLDNFATVNAVMEDYFDQPYPARAAVGVASLPKGADVEADAILGL